MRLTPSFLPNSRRDAVSPATIASYVRRGIEQSYGIPVGSATTTHEPWNELKRHTLLLREHLRRLSIDWTGHAVRILYTYSIPLRSRCHLS